MTDRTKAPSPEAVEALAEEIHYSPAGTLLNRSDDVHAVNRLIRDGAVGTRVILGRGVTVERVAKTGMNAFALKTPRGGDTYPAGMPVVAAAYAVCQYHLLGTKDHSESEGGRK